jgi:hypothetical protein
MPGTAPWLGDKYMADIFKSRLEEETFTNFNNRSTICAEQRHPPSLFIYLFIYYALPISHNHISAQIQTQEYTNYQLLNGRIYATALRQLQQPLQNEHDTFYIRSLVITSEVHKFVLKDRHFVSYGCGKTNLIYTSLRSF